MSEPSKEQIADDKAKIAELNNITGDKHRQRGGKAGFGILGFVLFILCIGLTSVTQGDYSYGEVTFSTFVLLLCGVTVVVCTFFFGFKHMDDIYNSEVASKKNQFKEKIKFSEIESRMATFPKLYQ